MKAEIIAKAIGNARRSGDGWLVCCPAHNDRNPSLSIADGEHGKLLVKCWAGCDARSVFAALGRYGFNPRDHIEPMPQIGKNSHKIKKDSPLEWSKSAENIWQAAIPIIKTPAEIYLCGRNCYIPSCDDLRFLPGKKYPSMVARVTDAHTAQPLTLHFTLLLPDGSGKAPVEQPKMLLKGHRKAGGIIRLTDDTEVTQGLGICEGIETALAVMATGWHPVWAMIDAGNMKAFSTLPGIEYLTIFADNDKAGLSAAKHCAENWKKAGRKTRVISPSQEGKDWADIVTVL